LQAAGTLSIGLVGAAGLASAARSAETTNSPEPHGAPSANSEATTADIVIEALIRWNVQFVFGIVGDGINPIIEALRKRRDQIRFIAVRHEEGAAFMASG
jgi:pyruvate dehydrogenase (quinone)